MNGYVDSFFANLLSYINMIFEIELVKYICSLFVVLAVIGVLRTLIHINK